MHFRDDVSHRANTARLAVIQGEYRHNLTFLGGTMSERWPASFTSDASP